MKTSLNFLLVLFIISIFSSGCEKDNPNPDDENTDVVIRISKMADNIGMEDPIVFHYNSEGLVNQIEDGIFIKSIEYDEQNRPIKWSRVEYDRPESLQTTNIEWTDDGFTIGGTIYTLDDDDRIIKRSTVGNTDEYAYVGESKVTIKRKDETGEIYESLEISFGEVNNPFRYFNVALTDLDYTVCPDDVASHHSKFAFSSYIEGDILTATYEVNEQNYPIRGTFNFSYDNSNDYIYYEYETD